MWRRVIASKASLLVLLAVAALALPANAAATSAGRVGVSSRGTSPTAARVLVGTWKRLAAAPSTALLGTAVWTGREMIIHGVHLLPAGGWRGTTVAYRPATNTWVRLANGPRSAGSLESPDVTVWTGSRMLVVGLTNHSYTPGDQHLAEHRATRLLPRWRGDGLDRPPVPGLGRQLLHEPVS